MSRVESKQVEEWTENPVTVALRELLQAELESIKESKADAFHPFDPQRTQEVLAGLNGSEDMLDIVLEILRGDWSYLEVDDEQLRD